MKRMLSVLVAVFLLLSFVSSGSVIAGERNSGKDRNTVIWVDGKEYVIDGDEGVAILGDDDGYKKIKVKEAEEKRAFIGIYMDNLDKKLREKFDYPHRKGVLVTDVIDESPAEEAGIEEGDIIYKFDGEPVTSSVELSALVADMKPGEKVTIVIYREGKEKKVELELGEHPWKSYAVDWDNVGGRMELFGKAGREHGAALNLYMRGAADPKGRLGVVLSELNKDLAAYFKVDEDKGVLILEVLEDTPAEKAGVKAGDVLVLVGGEEVSDVEDVMDEVMDIEEGEDVVLVVVREGKKQKLNLEIEEDENKRIMHIGPGEHHYKIEIPQIECFETPRIKMDRNVLEKELDSLKKEMKRLERRLKKLEKE